MRCLFVIGLALAVLFSGTASAASGLTVFRANRPGLLVKLWVSGDRIVQTKTASRVRCEGGQVEPGSATIAGWGNFIVKPDGEFRKQIWESYEGAGDYFMALAGRVQANSVTGTYRAWEERMGEETFYPRCGTVTPRGEEIRFKAHRVSGPRWKPSG